jgi:GH24 family phage-related lysozyme (muramidase)
MHFEGFEPSVEPDPVGIPTVGYGHVWYEGDPMELTKAEAEQLLRDELREKYMPEARAAAETRGLEWPLLSAGQKAAMVSFCYNLGPGEILDGSTWIDKWLAGKKDEAAEWYYKYNIAGGGIFAGLVRRRFAEWQMWLTGSWSQQPDGWEEYYEQRA